MTAIRRKRSLQRNPFDDNVGRIYQAEICVRVKIVGFLNRFWTRLTDRGFFALGITVGAFTTILVSIATGKMPDWLQRVLSHEGRIAEWLMVVFTIFAFFILLATLKTTREVGNAQVRAYLSVSKIKLNWEGNENLRSVEVIIENSGASPAKSIKALSCIAIIEPKDFHLQIGSEMMRETLRERMSISSESADIPSRGDRKMMITNQIPPSQIKRSMLGESDIFVYACVEYIDVFKGRQTFEYCTRFVYEETETMYVTHFEIVDDLCVST
jgi:hypothetical protein